MRLFDLSFFENNYAVIIDYLIFEFRCIVFNPDSNLRQKERIVTYPMITKE